MNREEPRASIFRRYYTDEPFIDRFAASSADAVDVIIPVVHTNELWESNLHSLYREIPVNRLLISDGGCKDDSLAVAGRFPRVTILDHRSYVSLGYCLRKLIEAVETEWFIYVHSDVYLPDGWFDAMKRHQASYDWFGCPQRITTLIEYPNTDRLFGELRPYAGSQMGRKSAFVAGLTGIDDDYVYRQEDYVLAGIVENAGFRHGRIEDTFHYHQVMHKPSPWARKLKGLSVQVEWSRDEEVRASTMQVKGIVKYLSPSRILAMEAESHLARLLELKAIEWQEFRHWVGRTNPAWLDHVKRWRIQVRRLLRPASVLSFLRELWRRLGIGETKMESYGTRLRTALAEQHRKLFDYENMRLKSEFAEYLNCPVCDSPVSSVHFKKDYFTFVRCSECSMVYLNPRLNDRATYEFYNSAWNAIYNEIKFGTVSKYTILDDEINLSNLVSINQHRNFQKGDKLLEIGSAKGYFLRKAKETGYNVYGIELNQKNYELARRELGDTVFNKDLFELQFASDLFNVIYMRDVFEHVPKPKEMLNELHRIAKKDCILYIEVPNIDGLIYSITKEKHVVVFGFEHLNYWSPVTLGRILESTGFSVEKITHESRDFSLRYIISYLVDQQFTALLPPTVNPLVKLLLKFVQKVCSVPPFRQLDDRLMSWFANMVQRGSVIKVIARKI